MMKSKSAEKIKLTSYDDLFGSSEVTAGEKVVSVPIRLFHTFKDHPFRVLDDEKMQDMYKERLPLYRRYADAVIKCDNNTVEQTAQQIARCAR